MMYLPCPYCGLRPQSEFDWGGQAVILRPGPPSEVSEKEWEAYLFHRDNPDGAMHEAWRHTHGCGQWFTLTRDTRTNLIVGSRTP